MKFKSETFKKKPVIVGQDPKGWYAKYEEVLKKQYPPMAPWYYLKSSQAKWEEIIKSVDRLLEDKYTIKDCETIDNVTSLCGLCSLFNPVCGNCPLIVENLQCYNHGLYEKIFNFIDNNEIYDDKNQEPDHNVSVSMLFKIKNYGEALVKYLGEIMVLLHNEDACARCYYCGRYSDNPKSLSRTMNLVCDCGRILGWSGSFKKPTEDSIWSKGKE